MTRRRFPFRSKLTLSVVALTAGIALVGCEDASRTINADVLADNDRGVALMGQYDYAAAEQVFAGVVGRAPDWLDARVNLAIATLNRQNDGDERLALDILATVLTTEPAHARALYTSAILHLYLGEAEPATRALTQVVAIDPQDAYAAYFLGQSLLQSGDYAGAAAWFQKTVALDPYLRSAYWAGSQALRRIGDIEASQALLTDYQRFETNPAARLAGFSYARMGPKAHAQATSPTPVPGPTPLLEGALFAQSVPLPAAPGARSLSVADVDVDGDMDLVVANGAAPAVLLGDGDGGFAVAQDHPLAGASDVRASLWGDLDDDGQVDLVFCNSDRAEHWRRGNLAINDGVAAAGGTTGPAANETGTWTHVQSWPFPCAGGALADADHDGDLDILLTGKDGFELLNNDRDGNFTPLASDLGLKTVSAGRQVLAADLDSDRDLDIIVLNDAPPHSIWRNELLWSYGQLADLADLRDTPLSAITVFDADADGHREIYGLGGTDLMRWRFDGGAWLRSSITAALPANADTLEAADFNGDQRLDLLVAGPTAIAVLDPVSGTTLHVEAATDLVAAQTIALEPGNGPALVVATNHSLSLLPPGPGRHLFLSLTLTGRSEAEQMRSNASGIGTLARVRAQGRWTIFDAIDGNSAPGQSLQPLAVGLGGHQQADFVALEWSDGVTQTELGLAAGQHHVVAETQRQLASCPVLFAWDGETFAFVSDVLGGAALGYLASLDADGGPVYAPPRPEESFLLAEEALVEREGHYQLKLAEPMEENVYLDAARLTVYDLPPGWDMVLDERIATAGAPATGAPIYFREALLPHHATGATGEDVTSLVAQDDRQAPPPGRRDPSFVGLLVNEQRLTMEFDTTLPENSVLVADGWIEYPYSQTVFAAWQAGRAYEPPTLDARDADGNWHTVVAAFGYPAGMPRTMALPLPALPPGTDALRLTSNMEIYWDRIRVVRPERSPSVKVTELSPAVATVARSGFAKRTTGPQRLPHYDYDDRPPYWDAKTPSGFYTRLGDALPLVEHIDGALAIFGSGEETHLAFPAVARPANAGKRYYGAKFHGWAKDMDPYTAHGQTVEPLPGLSDATDAQVAAREALHRRFNVRFHADAGY